MGKFKPGQPKPTGSGRQIGTPNRATSDLCALDKAEFDLRGEILGLLPNVRAEFPSRFDCASLI
jgi:hypothetical protein